MSPSCHPSRYFLVCFRVHQKHLSLVGSSLYVELLFCFLFVFVCSVYGVPLREADAKCSVLGGKWGYSGCFTKWGYLDGFKRFSCFVGMLYRFTVDNRSREGIRG